MGACPRLPCRSALVSCISEAGEVHSLSLTVGDLLISVCPVLHQSVTAWCAPHAFMGLLQWRKEDMRICQGLSVLKFGMEAFSFLYQDSAAVMSWTESCIAENAFMGFPPTAAEGSVSCSCLQSLPLALEGGRGAPREGKCPKVTPWLIIL